VTASLSTNPAAATPSFTVCGNGEGTKTCKLGTVGASQIELRAAVAVPTSAAAGEHVRLTVAVTAASPKPKNPVRTTAVFTVAAAAVAGAASSGLPAGTAGTAGLPAATGLGMTDLAGGSLPLVAPSAGGNVGAILPSISAVTPSPLTQEGPGNGTAAVANTSPLNRRLMGTQLLALAALCAAIGLVIARFTLRSPRPVPTGAGAEHNGNGSAAGSADS
jgi:hypothetical protein